MRILILESREGYCKIGGNNRVLVFRHNGLREHLAAPHSVRRVGEFAERTYDNRVDVYDSAGENEVYLTNFNWENCRNKIGFNRECKSFFLNYCQRSDGAMPFLKPLPHDRFASFYVGGERESLLVSWRCRALLFIPQTPEVNASRVNVFQILDEKKLVYRSNFQIDGMRGKDDFIGTCEKYFRIWQQANLEKNSLDHPVFNDFPWRAAVADNHWWQFDKWCEFVHIERETAEISHPLLLPFLKWKQTEGYKVDFHFPHSAS